MSNFQDFDRLHFVSYSFFAGALTGDIRIIAVMLSKCNLGMWVQNPLRSKENSNKMYICVFMQLETRKTQQDKPVKKGIAHLWRFCYVGTDYASTMCSWS